MEQYRKQQRKREAEKAKEEKKRHREMQLKTTDTRQWFDELKRLTVLEKQGILNRNGMVKLRQITDSLDRLIAKHQKADMDCTDLIKQKRAIQTMTVEPAPDAVVAYFKRHGRLPEGDDYESMGEEEEEQSDKEGHVVEEESTVNGIDLLSIPIPQGPCPPASYKPPPVPVEIKAELLLPDLPVYPPPQFMMPPAFAMSSIPHAIPVTMQHPVSHPIQQPPVRAPLPPTAVPSLTAAPVIQEAPKLRNLQKELTAFVPASVAKRGKEIKQPKQEAKVTTEAEEAKEVNEEPTESFKPKQLNIKLF